jgi:hypothetical protein
MICSEQAGGKMFKGVLGRRHGKERSGERRRERERERERERKKERKKERKRERGRGRGPLCHPLSARFLSPCAWPVPQYYVEDSQPCDYDQGRQGSLGW